VLSRVAMKPANPDHLAVPLDTIKAALTEAIRLKLDELDWDALTLLDAKQGAKLLGMTAQAFRKLPIDHFKLGEKAHRWRLSDIQAHLETRRVRVR
jgi:predicted DNA-binding transcriptional regulator AlpA